ncbi:MAG: hypothetical protein WD772_10650 [Pseudohongiellaceae bacterium]
MGRWGFNGWKPYVSVATKRAKADKAVQKAKKAGKEMLPVVLTSRGAIAKTFWGRAWCDNLEAYSDYENRLPRGRTYVRNGSVIDLKIEPGKILAQVMGSSLYRVEIGITAVSKAKWKALVKECTGTIASLVELLQGKFSHAVMTSLCAPKTGLFPSPNEIRFDCSCPDWATMCKHVAAVLYGAGARLDERPELLFTLRRVDAAELVTRATELPVKSNKAPAKSRVLEESALADVFGIEIATTEVTVAAVSVKKRKTPAKNATAGKATAPVSARKKGRSPG